MKNLIWTIAIIASFLLITIFAAVLKPQLTVRTFGSVPEKVVKTDFQQAAAPKIVPVEQSASDSGVKIRPVKTRIVEKTVIIRQTEPKTSAPAEKSTQTSAITQKTPEKPAQTNTPEPPKTQTPAQTAQKPVKQLTEAEELIVWNKWHSDLQNQIMRDSKIYSPRGTVFKFSFTVDKNRRISNIKVWSETTNTQPGDIYRIKTVISGYQNAPILEFPQGTKRIITNFKGGFTVSTSSRYSRPEDYSDVEKIKVKG